MTRVSPKGVRPKVEICLVSVVSGTSLAVDYRGVVLAHNDHFPMAAQRCAQSTITSGTAPGGGSACGKKEKALAGLYMSANVPSVGVTTLYAAVFGDVLPLSCVALVLSSMVVTGFGPNININVNIAREIRTDK